MEESSFTRRSWGRGPGWPRELVGRLVELGILRPTDGEGRYGLGDARRVRLVDACAQLCGEQGLPMELVRRVHEASGLGRPQPDDPIHPLDRDLLGSAQLGRMLGLDDG
jgi:hypothetical protein